MKCKKIILIIAVIFVVIAIAIDVGTLVDYNTQGREIIFIAHQRIPSEEGKTKEIIILVNKNGQYFTSTGHEVWEHGDTYMEIKEYYSKSDYEVEGRILNVLDMKRIYNNLKKIDMEKATYENETIERNKFSRFVLIATIDINAKSWDEEKKREGLELYSAGNPLYAYETVYLDDKYAVKIVDKLMKNWPFSCSEN